MALNLPRLQRLVKIANEEGLPTYEFHLWFQQVAENLESAFNDLESAVLDIQAAQDAADAAQAAATTAQDAADSVGAVSKLSNSGTSGLTLSATDAGADATINISAHTRLYADGTSVSVDSGSITGLAYSTTYYVYYDDSSFAGGAVTYLATTTQTTAAQTGDRHLVGTIITPAAAAGDTNGDVPAVPGFGGLETP